MPEAEPLKHSPEEYFSIPLSNDITDNYQLASYLWPVVSTKFYQWRNSLWELLHLDFFINPSAQLCSPSVVNVSYGNFQSGQRKHQVWKAQIAG